MITAMVKLHKVESVSDALLEAGILGLTTYEVRGFGKEHREQVEVYRGATYRMRLKPMAVLMTAVTDDMVDKVVETIREHANTGEISTGKVFVQNLEDAMRIRTGDRGDSGLQ
ncbi:MAG: P-II family nitrogen regulator [Gammaproteobacteria bacterium]|nr:P-II family nitrogen regulator [Gammaproteobacteria bacterium]MDA7990018.1 P-II family nitrogen regulator [Gammaproteobacteria bacterium]MDA8007210.1 P-II family nitrogen regulator [Gammaproteobacteria bacterium]MDA8014109.1 P-II family nitrogen regulator [Gammaproteobacteria bacterium]MDA8023850.1 P-II family nitrogen regulator [Gammaproteobacteria bacterium]